MLTPAQEQALQASQLAQMGGTFIPPQSMIDQNTGMPVVPPSKTTVEPHDTTTTHIAAPEALEAQRQVQAAQEAQQTARSASVPFSAVQDIATAEERAKYLEPSDPSVPFAKDPRDVSLNAGQFKDIVDREKADLTRQAEERARAARAELERQNAEEVQRLSAERDAANAEAAKLARPENLFAEPSAGTRILRAIALGLSTYAHYSAGHSGPSPVQIMIENEQNRDMQIKKAALDAAVATASRKGASLERLARMKQAGITAIEDQRAQQLHWVDAQINTLAARFPQHAQALAQQQAEIQEKSAKDSRDWATNALAKTRTHAGEQVTTVEGRDVGGYKPTEAEGKLSLLGHSMQDEISLIEKGPKLTSKELDQVQKDSLSADSADRAAESKGQLVGRGIGFGRSVGLVAKSRYSSLPPDKQKTLNAWDNLIEKYARMLTGAGMPAEEARRMARQNGPMAGDSPNVVQFKLDRLKREATRMVGLSGPGAEARVGSVGAQQRRAEGGQPAAASNPSKMSAEDYQMGLEAGRVLRNPKQSQSAKAEAQQVLDTIRIKYRRAP